MKIGRIYFIVIVAIILNVSYSAIDIIEPPELVSSLGSSSLKYSLAKFGSIPYGSNIIGQVYYPEPHDGCTAFNSSGIYFSFNNESDPSNNPIILIDRGNCVLTTKSKYAQLIGAKMVIIVQNTDQDITSLNFPDNGQGKYLHIPTIFINKEEGQKIEALINLNSNNKSPVVIRATFPASPSYDVVNYNIWYTANCPMSLDFLAKWKPYHQKLSPYVKFTPNYVLWYCTFCKLMNWTISDEKDCYSGGRYCAPDPDNMGPATGRQVVQEDLRQQCLWNVGTQDQYWNYVSSIVEVCESDKLFREDCHEKVYDKIGIDKDSRSIIEKCIFQGFQGNNPIMDDNTVLLEERKGYVEQGVQWWPAVYVEHSLVAASNQEPQQIFDAICGKFKNPPDVCNTFTATIQEKTDWYGIMFIVGSMLLVLFIGLFFYRRSLKREMLREMNDQVSTMISQYYALNEGKNSLP